MKFPCTLKNALLIIRDRFGLYFASKGFGYLAALLLPLPSLAHYKLSFYQTTPLLTISALEDITLLKTTCHFLLFLMGSTLLLIEKSYNWSPILVVHQGYFMAPLPWSEAPLVRKHLYSVLKFTVTCDYGKQSFEGFFRGIFTSTRIFMLSFLIMIDPGLIILVLVLL